MNDTPSDYVAPNGNGIRMPTDKQIKEASWRDLFIAIPKRLVALVGKMIGVKMLVLYGATALLLFTDKFPAWAWLIITGVVLFGREFLKYMKDVK